VSVDGVRLPFPATAEAADLRLALHPDRLGGELEGEDPARGIREDVLEQRFEGGRQALHPRAIEQCGRVEEFPADAVVADVSL
jgi:hypothetical protein